MRHGTLLVMALLAGSVQGLSKEYIRGNGRAMFRVFKQDYNKRYESLAEEEKRYQIFLGNLLQGAEYEAEQAMGASFGVNGFSDLTPAEFKTYHNLQVPAEGLAAGAQTWNGTGVAAPTEVDWRQKGAVTHVKNQGQCGSCWSFSTTGGIEGQWKLAGHSLTSLSEQELVACDKVDDGCNGGLMDNAFKWLLQHHGGQIVTEASYPYTSEFGIRGECHDVSGKAVGAKIKSYKNIAHNEAAMAEFVGTSGPLSIAVDAAKWQTYRGGVLTNCCEVCTLDHGVLIVGYAPDYWIIKNSWGPSWGESGYIRVKRGANECGLNKSPCTSEI